MGITNAGNIPYILQVTHMGQIAGAKFKVENAPRKGFLVYNPSSTAVSAKVVLVGGETVTYSFEKGWSDIIIREVVDDKSSSNLMYGF